MSRGIVIIVDGKAYHAGAYVLVRSLQELKCPLPIQIWGDTLPGINVDYREIVEPHDSKQPRAWAAKIGAILNSGFDDVLLLDSDCYPVYDPSLIFEHPNYTNKGAIFAKGWRFSLNPCITFINVKRYNNLLGTILNYRGNHGGDSCWFSIVFKDICAILPSATAIVHSEIFNDFEGKPLAVHRFNDKLRLESFNYSNKQHARLSVRVSLLPNEDLHFQLLQEYAKVTGWTGAVPGFPRFVDNPGPPWKRIANGWLNETTGETAYS